MSYFNDDHLKISDIIIDFEENITLISNFNELLLSINNLDQFNNLKIQLNDKLTNIENETNTLINTLKIIQFNIRKLYDDFAKMKCSYNEIEKKLKTIINDNYLLLNKNKDLEKQINYKNIIIDEQNKHILELIKSNKNNDKLIKDLKYQVKNRKNNYIINNKTKVIYNNQNQTINNDKIIHYEKFLDLKNIFNQNLKKQITTLTETNNKINNQFNRDISEASIIIKKNISTKENEKYIFKDELGNNNEDNENNNKIKNETSINNNSSIYNDKNEINCNIKLNTNIENNSNKKSIIENTKDKILNNKSNKNCFEKNIKKLKRKGSSAKNIHKIKNKNFEFDIGNNKLTSYFLFNLQREKLLNNHNTMEFIRKKNRKFKI